VLRLRRYSERISVQNQRFCSNGGRLTQNFTSKWSPPTFFFQKTRLNDLSYGIKNTDKFFVLFVIIHAFDRQTDGRTGIILIARPRLLLQRGKIDVVGLVPLQLTILHSLLEFLWISQSQIRAKYTLHLSGMRTFHI